MRSYLIGLLDVRLDPAAARRTAASFLRGGAEDSNGDVRRDLGIVLEAELLRSEGRPLEALRRL
ncbi:MAG: hypothetical protein GWO02_04505, partial [Gammaproteobacteria bacterium]|nr:hypothetical protein [Gammaproteobacteria bacterium]